MHSNKAVAPRAAPRLPLFFIAPPRSGIAAPPWRPAGQGRMPWRGRFPAARARRSGRHSTAPSRAEEAAQPVQLIDAALRRVVARAEPRLTHSMPCWAAKMASCTRVLSLSPLWLAELVKPAASVAPLAARQPALLHEGLEAGRHAAHVGRRAEHQGVEALQLLHAQDRRSGVEQLAVRADRLDSAQHRLRQGGRVSPRRYGKSRRRGRHRSPARPSQ